MRTFDVADDSRRWVYRVTGKVRTAHPAGVSRLLRDGTGPGRERPLCSLYTKDLAGKSIILDLLAEDAAGAHYDIEMQVRRFVAWSR